MAAGADENWGHERNVWEPQIPPDRNWGDRQAEVQIRQFVVAAFGVIDKLKYKSKCSN